MGVIRAHGLHEKFVFSGNFGSNVNQQFASPPPVRNPSPMDKLKQQRNQDSQQFKEHFNNTNRHLSYN